MALAGGAQIRHSAEGRAGCTGPDDGVTMAFTRRTRRRVSAVVACLLVPGDARRSVEIETMRAVSDLTNWLRPQMLSGFAVLCLLVSDAAAQSDQGEWKALAVAAVPVESPVLQTHLFPPRSARRPGNAAVLLERIAVYGNGSVAEERRRRASDLMELPKSEFDPSKARAAVRPPIHGLQRAAYRSFASWEYPLGEVRFGSILLPGISKIRTELLVLALEARCEAAEGNTEAALDRVATGFGVVDHVQSVPISVAKVSAYEMAVPLLQVVEETIEQQDCPNLYWALQSLPDPLVDTKSLVDWWRRSPISALARCIAARKAAFGCPVAGTEP